MGIPNVRKWIGGVWHDATLKINIEEGHGGGDKLIRQMGLFSVILFTITSAVGSGILTTPGIIAREYAGPHAYMSFVQAGLICLCPALCLAFMASRTAKSGSTGSYACIVLGQLPGLLMFVDVMMECIGGTAAVAVSQADHIKMIVALLSEMCLGRKIELSPYWTTTPHDINWWLFLGATASSIASLIFGTIGWRGIKAGAAPGMRIPARLQNFGSLAIAAVAGCAAIAFTAQFLISLPSVNILSVGVVVIVSGILLLGVKETAAFTNGLTITKLVVLSAICVLLGLNFDSANLNLPIPKELPGSLAGASVAFFAFVGLDLATTTAGEVKNAKRNVPLGMLIGLACVTVLYFLASYLLCAAVPYHALGKGEGEAAPMIQALVVLGYKNAAIWIAVGSTIALVSVVLASAYATTRLLFNMAQHGLMPSVFEKVSKRQVPVVATFAVCGVISLLTGLVAIGELMHLTNIGTMTAFITISVTVLIITVKETRWKTARGAAKGIAWLLVSTGGIVGPAILMLQLPWESFARLIAVWSAVVLLFVFYSRHHSLARKQTQTEDHPTDK